MIEDVEKIIDLTGSAQYKKLFRINYNGKRLYVQTEPFAYYSGLTGALSAATFAGDPGKMFLKSWREGFIDNFGIEKTNSYVEATADFGSLVHAALVRIKENGALDWNEERDIAEEEFKNTMLKSGSINLSVVRRMVYDYQKHVGALMQFIYERVDKIHAIEVPAIWEELKIATPIDIVCSCRQTPKGDFEETTVNIKTSSQISPSHMEQIACEMHMWNLTYDNREAEFTAILRTKDWVENKTPTFEYKSLNYMEASDKAGEVFKRLWLCLNSPSTYFPDPTSKKFTGVSKLGEMPTIEITGIEDEFAEWWTSEQIEETEVQKRERNMFDQINKESQIIPETATLDEGKES